MSTMCKILKELLYLNLINCHTPLYYANQTDISPPNEVQNLIIVNQ